MKQLLASNRRRRQFSVERFESLHLNLLQHVLVDPKIHDLQAVDARNTKFTLSLLWKKLRQSNSEYSTEQQDRCTAFRDMIAIKLSTTSGSDDSSDKCGSVVGDEPIESLQERERTVVECIRAMGEVLINSEQTINTSLRSDPVFEYFCDRKILHLLVDLAKEKPQRKPLFYHEVSWSSLVKAQVIATISLLISTIRDTPALYFILSQNCINELILCITPLSQWTDIALNIILPVYVDLLKHLALQLSASPHLYPFFARSETFPLFSAALQTARTAYSQSNSLAHASCLRVLVELLPHRQHQQHQHLQSHSQLQLEQQILADHLCAFLLDQYGRFRTLLNGPVVNTMRSVAMTAQIANLHDQILILNSFFSCQAQSLNVRLCETLLQRFVSVLVADLTARGGRPMLWIVGETDTDVIPPTEAASQAATFVLAKLMERLDYRPFVRMLAVAIFHPKTTPLWSDCWMTTGMNGTKTTTEYQMTTALNDVVREKSADSVENPCRACLIKTLAGEYGLWKLVPVAILLEKTLRCETLDSATLQHLSIVPVLNEDNLYAPTSFEMAVASFLRKPQEPKSLVSTMAIECAASLAVEIHSQMVLGATNKFKVKLGCLDNYLLQSPTRHALIYARSNLFRATMECQKALCDSNIFIDLMQAAVTSRYKRNGVSFRSSNANLATSYTCALSLYGVGAVASSSDVLIRNAQSSKWNNVEATRFNVHMALHLRAICRVLERYEKVILEWLHEEGSKKAAVFFTPKLSDTADELAFLFDSNEVVSAGSDVDLRGTKSFPFSIKRSDDSHKDGSKVKCPGRAAQLLLVLDPRYMLVVRVLQSSDRGIILCCISWRNVIAAATDNSWLHVAVRNQNIEALIKNGNMVMLFNKSETSSTVKQYLDECRKVIRDAYCQKLNAVFAVDAAAAEDYDDYETNEHPKRFEEKKVDCKNCTEA
jgi:hypothetical protein